MLKPSPPKRKPILKIKPLTEKPGSAWTAYLLAENQSTPSMFWLFLTKNKSQKSELECELAVAGRGSQTKIVYHPRELQPGDVCLVHIKVEGELKWNRGQVICQLYSNTSLLRTHKGTKN
jgi:hypothetical protein